MIRVIRVMRDIKMNKVSDGGYSAVLSGLDAADNRRSLREMELDGRYIVVDGQRYVNLSSNDYLGLASQIELQEEFFDTIFSSSDHSGGRFLMSNPSSRLMTGNSSHYRELEDTLAEFFDSQAALVLGSGYLLNSGILGALCESGDLIVADKLVHSSIIDGVRLSGARFERFRHNDMAHLEAILRRYASEAECGGHSRKMCEGGGRVIVVTESLFSMDGDFAPLSEIARLQREYDFMLYLDEAHAFGVLGDGGRGVSFGYPGLRVDVYVATMGKALASQGAFVICSSVVRDMLVNRMRTLIFSTALPPISLMWSRFLIERLSNFSFEHRRAHLAELVAAMGSFSHIVPVMCGENREALALADKLAAGVDLGSGSDSWRAWATAIRHPTVAQGQARVRISLNAALEMDDIYKIKEICNIL